MKNKKKLFISIITFFMSSNRSVTDKDAKTNGAILYNIIRIFKCKDTNTMQEKVLGTVEKEQMIDSALHYLREQYKEHSSIDIPNDKETIVLEEIDQHVLIDKKNDYFTEE